MQRAPSPQLPCPQQRRRDHSIGATCRAAARTAAAVILFLVLWQFVVPLAHVPDYVLPLPSVIAHRFVETFSSQLVHLGVTASTTLAGLAIALVSGVLLALLVVYVASLKSIILPFLAAFNSIPKIAIAPLFVIWFGLGVESKILLAFLLALFPIFVNSLTDRARSRPTS